MQQRPLQVSWVFPILDLRSARSVDLVSRARGDKGGLAAQEFPRERREPTDLFVHSVLSGVLCWNERGTDRCRPSCFDFGKNVCGHVGLDGLVLLSFVGVFVATSLWILSVS